MSTIFSNVFSINGVIDTNQSVLDNMNTICTCANAWLTYDIAQGKWCVVINTSGEATQKSFDDTNIIGNINVSGTGVSELYNRVEVEFPHKDLRDEKDYVVLSIPEIDRFPNETDNTLTIKLECINDPLQAQYIGSVELKQNRLDKIIEFRTNFTTVGLKAGDIIEVTNSMYGFTNKKFRVIKLSEEDSDDGNVVLSVTALEFDESIYSTSGLVREPRNRGTGIILKTMNDTAKAIDDIDAGSQMMRLLAANAITGLLDMLFSKDPLTGKVTQTLKPKDGIKEEILKKIATPTLSLTGPDEVCECDTVTINVNADSCIAACMDGVEYDYTITGVQAADITIPLTGKVSVSNGTGSLVIPLVEDGVTESETMTVKIGDKTHTVKIKDNNPSYSISTTPDPAEITEGESITVNVTTSAPDGTVVPWKIEGSGSDKVDGALTGTATVTSGAFAIDIFTKDDATYTGDETITVTIATDEPDCSCDSAKSKTITIKDNETPPVPDTTCEWVTIPIAWCGTYDGTTGNLKSVAPYATMTVAKKVTGNPSATVPLTVTVTSGATSTIAVATTVEVCTASGQGGFDANVITSFDPVPANQKLITGTTTTVRGF